MAVCVYGQFYCSTKRPLQQRRQRKGSRIFGREGRKGNAPFRELLSNPTSPFVGATGAAVTSTTRATPKEQIGNLQTAPPTNLPVISVTKQGTCGESVYSKEQQRTQAHALDRAFKAQYSGKLQQAVTLGGGYCSSYTPPTALQLSTVYALSAKAGQQIFCKGIIDGIEREALIDPGTGCSILGATGVGDVGPLTHYYKISTVTGSEIRLKGLKPIRVQFGDLEFTHEIIVTADMPRKMLLIWNDILGGKVWGIHLRRAILYVDGSSPVHGVSVAGIKEISW